jgi:tetratricopeptide (TPR) repeat protein
MARALVVVLLCSLAAPAHAAGEDQARAHYQLGLALYNDGKFEEARAEFETGFRLFPLPLFLFNAAQAARKAGDLKHALELYKQFVAADPQSRQRSEAEQQIAAIASELPPEPVADQTAAPVPEAKPAPVAAAQPAPTLTSAPRRRWAHDPAGGVLLGVGIAGAVAGATLLGIGGAQMQDANSSYDSFIAARNAQSLVIAGGITLGVGALLAIGAAIRYRVVARRR